MATEIHTSTAAPFGARSAQTESLCRALIASKDRPVSASLLEEAQRYHRTHALGKKTFARTLIDQELATDAEIASYIAAHHNLEVIQPSQLSPKSAEARNIIPAALARSALALPLECDPRRRVAVIAVADLEQPGLNQLRYLFSADWKVRWAVAPFRAIEGAIELVYTPRVQSENELTSLVEAMLQEAASKGASDIHINPDENLTRIFFRIDGQITPWRQVPPNLKDALTTQVKLATARGEDGRSTRPDVAGGGVLDIARTQVPQDARASRRWGALRYSLRFSSLPTAFGETIVIRLLDQNAQIASMRDLGLLADHQNEVQKTVEMPHGILCMVGPTGSGKSTTLAAALKIIDPMEYRILSAEDPMEYRLRGVMQAQVNAMMSFEDILRTSLRQDPDVILVGEIRNKETARIAITAANTGHLILSTVHANSAVLGFSRLLNLEVTADLMMATVRVFIAQRLVRKLCPKCSQPHPLRAKLAEENSSLLKYATPLMRAMGHDGPRRAISSPR